MNLFQRLFNNNKSEDTQPQIKVGRYSDAYKSSDQYDAWDDALQQFEEGEYLNAYETFFKYLGDEHENNVIYTRNEENLHFEILQGSKRIKGYADNNAVKVETKVAKADKLKVSFMRRLMELNFNLKYSRYALNDNNDIVMLFETYTLDGSPYKLYYALKELATSSDKQDDLLIDEFDILQASGSGLIQNIPELEKEVKYNFIQKKIQQIYHEVDNGKLNATQYPGGIAYLWLNLTYMLDYLTKPEGYMMEVLERIHRVYFAKDGKSTIQKNQFLYREFQKLNDRPKEEFFKEMYNVTSTFGITSPVNHDKVVSFIDGELHNMNWYKEHGHEAIAMSVSGYIIGYCLFNYAVPQPDKELFYLYYQVVEADYFKALGFTTDFYDTKNKQFNKKAIENAIERIADKFKPSYPNLYPKTASLNYNSLPDFAQSFLIMIRQLDMTKLD